MKWQVTRGAHMIAEFATRDEALAYADRLAARWPGRTYRVCEIMYLVSAKMKAKRNRRDYMRGYMCERRSKPKPFVAIDSEGVSYGDKITLDNGDVGQKQRTVFWGAGNEESGTSFLDPADPLTSPFLTGEEIIDWLLDLPTEFGPAIFVWFGSSYDATQIFCDLPYAKAWELQRGEPYDKPGVGDNSSDYVRRSGRYVLHGRFAYSYIKQKCLKIGELYDRDRPRDPRSGSLRFRRQITIYDVFGFFQSSFLKAAGSIPGAMTAKERATIEEGKKDRSAFTFEKIPQMQRYTVAELLVLARMMERLRESLNVYDLKLSRWQGAGSIAASLFKKHGSKEHFRELQSHDLPVEQEWAHRAFFGGRIECLKQGRTDGKLYAYDIRSAYPFHMSLLPSLRGGKFVRVAQCDRRLLERASPLSMFRMRLDVECDDGKTPGSLNRVFGSAGPHFYPLPYRDEGGRITYPPRVHGIYMQAEAAAAFAWLDKIEADYEKRGLSFPGKIEICEALLFEPASDEKPFAWLREMYAERRAIVAEAAKTGQYNLVEKVIKLGINSVYGKTAQSVGSVGSPPSTACPWVAAAITAGTRAQLLRAALTGNANSIVAFQTDGIVATKRLSLETGSELGRWEEKNMGGRGAQPSIFVQPGVYSYEETAKHRGIKMDLLGADKFETWLEANAVLAWRDGIETVEYPYRYYVTLGSAVASPERWKLAGYWVDGKRELQLNNLGHKRAAPWRDADRRARADRLVDTVPKPALYHRGGDANLPLSEIYRPDWLDAEFAENSELERLNEEIALAME